MIMRLLLLLLAHVAAVYPTTRFQDLEPLPKGTKLVSVVRNLKIDFTYSLAGVKDTWIPWTKFPELDDQIQLDFNQYVRMSYRITVIFWPIASHFRTRLLINNVQDKRFTYFTGWSDGERVHVGEGRVWLPKGNHSIRLEYIVNNNVPVQKMAEWGVINFLELEYYKLVSIN